MLKVATFAAQLGYYDKAIDKFEAVANESIDNQLMKWSLKEYFLKAGLCHLASGVGYAMGRGMSCYQDINRAFYWALTDTSFTLIFAFSHRILCLLVMPLRVIVRWTSHSAPPENASFYRYENGSSLDLLTFGNDLQRWALYL